MKKAYLALAICLVVAVTGCKEDIKVEVNDPPATDTSPNLPPDPGEAGKATIEGIDTDKDGVRDDVQIAIYERHPVDEKVRKALEANSMALQQAIVGASESDNEKIYSAMDAIGVSSYCLVRATDNPHAESDFVERKMMNTSERSAAYMKFSEAMNGQFFGVNGSEADCQ